MERRTAVRESVDLLVKKFTHHPEPIHIQSLAYAMIELFPQLKSVDDEGIELLYNRKLNRGYIISKLQRLRTKYYSLENSATSTRKRKSKHFAEPELSLQIDHPVIDFENNEDFMILKNANVNTQKELIKSKLIKTLNLRIKSIELNQIENHSISFPFYFTSPDLISFNFSLRYPHADNLNAKWPNVCPHIFKIYLDLKGSSYERLPEVKEWTESIKPILYLLNLLPQQIGGVSSSKKIRDSFRVLINKIVVFKKINLTIQELKEANAIHPYLIAVGENKLSISSFYLCVEDEIIILPDTYSSIETFDLLFKSHYIFNQKFDSAIKTFYNFIASYFYKISCSETPTVRIKEISSKLEIEMANLG